MGQAETREVLRQVAIRRGVGTGITPLRVDDDEEDEDYYYDYEPESPGSSEDEDYGDEDEEEEEEDHGGGGDGGLSSPLTETFYRDRSQVWPIRFRSAPDVSTVRKTKTNLQLGEALLASHWQQLPPSPSSEKSEKEPSSPSADASSPPASQEQQIATAVRLFYAAYCEMQFREGTLASRIRLLALVGLITARFRQIQLLLESSSQDNGAGLSGLQEKVKRLAVVITSLIKEPVLSWYFAHHHLQPSVFIRLYTDVWSHVRASCWASTSPTPAYPLPPTIPQPPLLPFLTEVLTSELVVPYLGSKTESGPGERETVFHRLEAEIDDRLWLARSGAFGGTVSRRSSPLSSNVQHLLRERELYHLGFSPRLKMTATQSFLPQSHTSRLIGRFGTQPAYCGQFSKDGTLFHGAWKNFKIRLFDTTAINNSSSRGAESFKLIKTIHAAPGQWTITDCQMSTDNRFLVYSSIQPVAHLCYINDDDRQVELDFAPVTGYYFGIWSLRISADNREVIAGTNQSTIGVFDLESARLIFETTAHDDDVNAVCFLEDGNPNVFASGSDDSFIKIWDRRAMTCSQGRPSGVLSGHTEGITYVSPKGDGRYIVSNGKDQTMKLWDIRKMSSEPKSHARYRWDYRGMDYPGNPFRDRHPQDQSLVTCVGHHVVRTLIRCHFSPAETTGQRYLYSGSADGFVYIYDLSGTLVSRLQANPNNVVRDVSWHPDHPAIVATSWNGALTSFTYSGETYPPEGDPSSSPS